ncbi:hypothetical protein L4X63_09205, partial [Geomonas sp. Red32]
MRNLLMIVVLLLVFSSQAFGAAFNGPAWGTFSSATGGTLNAGKQGTNTLQIIGGTIGQVGGKPTLTIPSLPYVRMTDFMDGKAGRPTFNQWSSAQATTSIYSAYQAAKA